MAATEPNAPATTRRQSLSISALAWAGYQGGRDPYVTLISIYIFMPYVATVMVGDAVNGQAMIAGFAMVGGLIAALTAGRLQSPIPLPGGTLTCRQQD